MKVIQSILIRRTVLVFLFPCFFLASVTVEALKAIRDSWNQFVGECKSNWDDLLEAAREGWLKPRDLIALRMRDYRKSKSWAMGNDPNHVHNRWIREQFAEYTAKYPKKFTTPTEAKDVD